MKYTKLPKMLVARIGTLTCLACLSPALTYSQAPIEIPDFPASYSDAGTDGIQSLPQAQPSDSPQTSGEAPPISDQGVGIDLIGNQRNHASTTNGVTTGPYHIPPDTDCAVGPTHLMMVMNKSVRIQSLQDDNDTVDFRLGGLPAGSTSVSGITAPQFFAARGTQPSTDSLTPAPQNSFDPRILYDHLSGRWVVVILDRSTAPNTSRILIAVSQTSDPTGIWFFRQLDSLLNVVVNGVSQPFWADFPRIAVDGEALYITNSMFAFNSGVASQGSKLWIVKKSSLYSSTRKTETAAQTATYTTMHDPVVEAGLATATNAPSYQSGGFSPAQITGSTASGNDAGVNGGKGTYLVSLRNSFTANAANSNRYDMRLVVIRVDNPISSTARAFIPREVNLGPVHDIAAFNGATSTPFADAPQSNAAQALDTGDLRIHNAVWKAQRLFFVNTVWPYDEGTPADNSGEATVHWGVLDTTNFATNHPVIDPSQGQGECRG